MPAELVPGSRRRWPVSLNRQTLQLAALTTTSVMLMLSFGYYSLGALVLLFVAGGLTLAARYAPDGEATAPAWAVALAGSAAIGSVAYYEPSGFYKPLIALLAILLGAVIILRSPRLVRVTLAGCFVVLVAMVMTQWHWGVLVHDVYGAINAGAGNLLHLHNPYDALYLNKTPIGPERWAVELGHFPYGPGVALLALPGVVLGDARAMDAVAFVVIFAAVAVLARRAARPGHVTRSLALCAAFPLTVPMIHFAWVDSMTIAGFAAWLALRTRHQSLAAIALGVALAAKPTFAPALLPFFFWSAPARRQIALAALVAVLICLPFIVVTGPARFFAYTVGTHTVPLLNSLTLTTLLYRATGHLALPAAVSVLAVLGALLATSRRRPRDLSDVLCAGSFVCLVTFAFANQAFMNFYFQSAALLLLAVAARGVPFEAAEVVRRTERAHGLRAAYPVPAAPALS